MDRGKKILKKYGKKIRNILSVMITDRDRNYIRKINSGEIRLEYGNIEQTEIIRRFGLVDSLIEGGDIYNIILLLNQYGGNEGLHLSIKINDEYNV